ncbi:MAG: enoyl-CoA hydratase [Pseudomonadota bacterium]
MNTATFSQNVIAAVFAVAVSAVLYAAAIVPASPSLLA